MAKDLILTPQQPPPQQSGLAALWDRISNTQIPLGSAEYGLGVDVNDILKPLTDNRGSDRMLPESFSLNDVGKLLSLLPHMADVKTMAEGQVKAQTTPADPNEPYGQFKRLLALFPMIGAEGGGAVAPATERGFTTLGTNAGVKSATADLKALAKAKRMVKAGESAAPDGRIRQVTGWYQEPGGRKWQYEISDQDSAVMPHPTDPNRYEMHHPKLFEAYPQAADIPIHKLRPDGDYRGWYGKGADGKPEIGIAGGMTEAELRSTGLHEMGGHAIQDIEGFARGSNPDRAGARREEAISVIDDLADWEELKPLIDAAGGSVEQAVTEFNRDPTRTGYHRHHVERLNDTYGNKTPEQLEALHQRHRPWAMTDGPMHAYEANLGEFAARDIQARRDYPDWKRQAVPPYSSETAPPGGWIDGRDPTGSADMPAISSMVGRDFAVKKPPDTPVPDPEATAGKSPVVRRDLFDYTRLNDVPQVAQIDLQRNVPARGPSARVQALDDKKTIKRINETVSRGAKDGIPWYNTEPLRQSFIDEFGMEEGGRRFSLYMDMVAGTSPRSDVGTNARNASYYYQQAIQGNQPGKPLPKPYGHLAQDLHIQNFNNIMEHGGMGPETTFPVLQNPKPPSFSQNLQGNQQPITADTHLVRNWGVSSKLQDWLLPSFKPDKDAPTVRPRDMVASGAVKMKNAPPVWWDSMPKANEYPMLELLSQSEARKMGMTPAQWQASAWVGGGGETGLASGADPFLRHFENRVILTAQKMGITPMEALRQFQHGKITLLSPPVVPHAAGAKDEPQDKDVPDPPPKTERAKKPPVSLESLIGVL